MKRVFVSVGILLFVAALCAVTLFIQKSETNKLIRAVDDIRNAYDRGDMDNCLALSEEFVSDFKKRTRLFPYFMRHSDISKIEETASVLPVMIRTGGEQHFAAELAKCRNMLLNLKDFETPVSGNIL